MIAVACPVAESTVREYVREQKHALGLSGQVTCIPQSYAWAEEGQVDWSPYTVELGGETRVVHGFSCVLPFSSYIFLRFAFDETLHDHGATWCVEAVVSGRMKVRRFELLATNPDGTHRFHERETADRAMPAWAAQAPVCWPPAWISHPATR